MGENIVLNNLQKRNNSLKSLLVHDQLKYGTYHFGYFKKYLLIINEYKKHKSFFKVSSVVNVTHKELISWYIQGQMGNPKFRSLYLAIENINNSDNEEIGEKHVPKTDNCNENDIVENDLIEGDKDYIISQYGDGWSYKAFIGGEKIFIIANELKTLKEKVKAKHLPID